MQLYKKYWMCRCFARLAKINVLYKFINTKSKKKVFLLL